MFSWTPIANSMATEQQEISQMQFGQDRVVHPDRLAYAAVDLLEDPEATLRIATPVILSPVGERGEKTCQEISARGMDLHAVETSGLDPSGRLAEVTDDRANFPLR